MLLRETWNDSVPFKRCFVSAVRQIFTPGPGLLFLYLFLLPLDILHARTIRICDTGCQFSSLQEGLRRSGPGDTLEIYGGEYRGNYVVRGPRTVRGFSRPVIDAEGKGDAITVEGRGVTLEGLLIRNSGKSDIKEFGAIRAREAEDCRFSDNLLINNTYGIYLENVDGCTIENNISVSNARSEVLGGNGIHSWYSNHLLIRHNILFGHRDGIYLEFSEHLDILENTASHSLRYGLHFMFSHDNRFYNNVFTRNQTGVAVMYSKRIVMTANRFEESRGKASYGMLLKDIQNSRIEKNLFYHNTLGMDMDNSTGNSFYGNEFYRNGRAIHLPGNNEHNQFENNVIRDNFFDVSTNSRHMSNTFQENFWSSCRGYDLNRDGFADRPCHPVRVFDYWVGRFPVLSVLLLSPVVEFLELSERAFPVVTPTDLVDPEPRMEAPVLCSGKSRGHWSFRSSPNSERPPGKKRNDWQTEKSGNIGREVL